MTAAGTCSRERELLDALGRGFVGRELEGHVAECPACTELRAVVAALLDDRSEAVAEAPVPSAGTMWWRMRLRQRREAEARARRPLLVGQAVTLLVAMMVAAFLFGADIGPALGEGFHGLARTLGLRTPILFALVGALLLLPVGGWIALRQK